jgi:hypothetical protein
MLSFAPALSGARSGSSAFHPLLKFKLGHYQDCRAVRYFRTEVETIHAAVAGGAGNAPAGICQAAPAAPSSVIKRRGPAARAPLRRMSGAAGGLSFSSGGGGECGPIKSN